jgi:hypothetical protein
MQGRVREQIQHSTLATQRENTIHYLVFAVDGAPKLHQESNQTYVSLTRCEMQRRKSLCTCVENQ